MAGSKVEHPSHYTKYKVECLEVVRHCPFNIGNAIKYIWRREHKGSYIEDCEKAIFYLKDHIAFFNDRGAIIRHPLYELPDIPDLFLRKITALCLMGEYGKAIKEIEAHVKELKQLKELDKASPEEIKNADIEGRSD